MFEIELWLYLALLVISLILVALSLYRNDHAELGIVGFTFIFILSFVMIAGDIQYKVGVNETNTYGCLCCVDGVVYDDGDCGDNSSLQIVYTEKMNIYDTFTAGGVLSRTVGYWLAVLAVVGLIGIFVSLKAEGFMRPK